MKITNTELTLLRTRPHTSKLWLSIYQPTTTLSARVNDATIAKGEREVTYDNAVGSYQLIEDGMVLLVGITPGGSEKGRIRVRSATSTVLTLAENDHINWEDNDYLTVLNYIEITAVFPRIIQDPADDENVIFYKDYDIAYTNQNSELGSFVNMGGHTSIFLENGAAQVYFSASGTYNLLERGIEYAWWFQGATSTGSSVETPGYVTWDTPGHYAVRLNVTATGTSVTDSSYRYVSVYDRPENGSSNPILSWELVDFVGDRAAGGYTARIRLHEQLGFTLLDNSLVVIMADDWYGDTEQSIGGNRENRQQTLFSGYIKSGTIQYNYASAATEFEVVSPTLIAREIEVFSVSCESKANPATWFEILDMDCKRAAYHYWKWHSTFLKLVDVRFPPTFYDRKIQFFDADRTSLFDAVSAFVESTLFASVVSDRQGTVWIERNVGAIDNAENILETTFSLDKQDWMGEPIIQEQIFDDSSFLEIGGIAYSGSTTGTSTAYLSAAPGETPGYWGKLERLQGFALESQDELNILGGNIYANRNMRYPDNQYTLNGNYRNFDIAPIEVLRLYVQENDTQRGIEFNGSPFTIRSMNWVYNGMNGSLYPAITISEVTQGFPGDTLPIPEVAPFGGYEVPPFQFPPFPSICPPGIRLYDEGVFVAEIDALDFIGSPVVATANETHGNVTVLNCTGSFYGVQATAWLKAALPSITPVSWSGSSGWQSLAVFNYDEILEAQLSLGTGTSGRSEFTAIVDGAYEVDLSTSILFALSASSPYYAKAKIEHYDVDDVWIKTWESGRGSPASLYYDQTTDPPTAVGSNTTSTVPMTALAMMKAGEKLKFFADAEGVTTTATVSDGVLIVYRIA